MQKDKGFMPAIILTIICLVTAILLVLTNQLTYQTRIRLEVEAAEADRNSMFPSAASFEPIDVSAQAEEFPGIDAVYAVRDTSNALIGFVIESHHRGYAGNLPLMVAINKEAEISNLKILANEETPGLGKKVENKSFYEQFIGESISKEFTVNPADAGEVLIDAVAGATISSRAVAESINQASAVATKLAAEVK